MMVEHKHRCRLYFQVPMQPSPTLAAQLAQAMASTDAACVLLCPEESSFDHTNGESLIELVQSHGLACLIEKDAGLAEGLGADGVHIEADPAIYADARKRLGESASIGAGCGLNRHHAMLLAEKGADYVAFGSDNGNTIDVTDQHAELIAWWSEIFVVPCVAWNVDRAEQAAKLAALGADFIAPSTSIWEADDALKLIAEIDSAIRQSRRAA
jgi:thiamine-phosphate pyrophosphorylase